MKLTYIFSRAGRVALAAALGLFIFAPSVSQATIVVLKEGTAIDYSLGVPSGNYSTGVAGGNFGAFTQFLGISSATNVHVDDVKLTNNTSAANGNIGNQTSMGANTATAILFKWDLSGLAGFSNSEITAAVVRLYITSGNGAQTLGTLDTHDYVEGDGSAGSGATLGSPAGNTVVIGGMDGEWGAGANALFSVAGDSTAGSATTLPTDSNSAKIVGAGYTTFDVKVDLQAMADGAVQYGWVVPGANYNFLSSENSLDGARPALFIDYKPVAVPEPSAFLFGGLVCGLVGFAKVRKSRVCKERSLA